MKKILSFFALLLMFTASVSAQDKKNVCIDEFEANSSINANWVKTLRNNVIEGLMKTGRLNVIDVTTISGLSKTNEEKLIQLGERNVDVLLKGHFNSLTSTSKTKDGKTTYEVKAGYSLTLIDTQTGATLNTTNFEESWYSGTTSDESITKALDGASGHMKKFVDDNFKASAVVKALDQVDAKKGAKTIYVSVGSNAGIQAGQMFDVFQEVEVAGEKITKQIGSAKAKEVVSGTLTLCTVTKGGVDIKNAFENNITLTVVSRARGGIGGLLDSL